jgi:hypothetical protein
MTPSLETIDYCAAYPRTLLSDSSVNFRIRRRLTVRCVRSKFPINGGQGHEGLGAPEDTGAIELEPFNLTRAVGQSAQPTGF